VNFEEKLPMKPISPSTTTEGWMAFILVTACFVWLTLSSNGNAEASNATQSKPASAASRADAVKSRSPSLTVPFPSVSAGRF